MLQESQCLMTHLLVLSPWVAHSFFVCYLNMSRAHSTIHHHEQHTDHRRGTHLLKHRYYPHSHCWRRRITRNGRRITTPRHRFLILRRGTPNKASRLILIVVYVRLSCVLVSRVAASLLLYSGLFSTPLRLFSVMTSIRLYIVSGRCFF